MSTSHCQHYSELSHVQSYKHLPLSQPVCIVDNQDRNEPLNILPSLIRNDTVVWGISPYWYFIEAMSVCRTVYEIFSIKEWRNLETGGRGRSRSLKIAKCDRSYVTCYWSAIVSIAVWCTIFKLFDIVTLKRPFRKLGCGFLFAFHSNYGCTFNRLWDIQCQSIAWPWKLG